MSSDQNLEKILNQMQAVEAKLSASNQCFEDRTEHVANLMRLKEAFDKALAGSTFAMSMITENGTELQERPFDWKALEVDGK